MERLISALGLFTMVGLAWLMSSHKRRINWRVVIGGLLLQFLFALIILRTGPGQFVFRQIGDFFTNIIGYVDAGSGFMFDMESEFAVPVQVSPGSLSFDAMRGDVEGRSREILDSLEGERGPVAIHVGDAARVFDLQADGSRGEAEEWIQASAAEYIGRNFPRTRQLLKSFAFGVLPTIVFFSSLMSMLYYLGVMQKVVALFAWIMQRTLGTSGAESLSAAANIFVGQTEAPLVIRPYIESMTVSELNAVMVGGFATIAGGVLAAFVSMGIDAGHLVTASVISAPAALLIAKVMQPETEHSKTLGRVEIKVQQKAANLIEAAAAGAADGMKLALNVGAMLIAFLALIAMLNGIIGWTGGLFGFRDEAERWTLETGLSYVFLPLAWLMGIPAQDCFQSGELLGIKMVANEFIAYDRLGWWIRQGSQNPISDRSVMILTYALSGFANFSSIGIQLGGIGGIAPNRRSDLAQLGLRAMIGGTLAAFMTACVAGMLM